jgi:hypothetical protein
MKANLRRFWWPTRRNTLLWWWRYPDYAHDLMRQHWPGALTLVLPAQDPFAHTGAGEQCVGATHPSRCGVQLIRLHTPCAKCWVRRYRDVGQLRGSRGARRRTQTLEEVAPELRSRVDLVLDGGKVGGQPSTIIDCTGAAPRIPAPGRAATGAVAPLRVLVVPLPLYETPFRVLGQYLPSPLAVAAWCKLSREEKGMLGEVQSIQPEPLPRKARRLRRCAAVAREWDVIWRHIAPARSGRGLGRGRSRLHHDTLSGTGAACRFPQHESKLHALGVWSRQPTWQSRMPEVTTSPITGAARRRHSEWLARRRGRRHYRPLRRLP